MRIKLEKEDAFGSDETIGTGDFRKLLVFRDVSNSNRSKQEDRFSEDRKSQYKNEYASHKRACRREYGSRVMKKRDRKMKGNERKNIVDLLLIVITRINSVK